MPDDFLLLFGIVVFFFAAVLIAGRLVEKNLHPPTQRSVKIRKRNHYAKKFVRLYNKNETLTKQQRKSFDRLVKKGIIDLVLQMDKKTGKIEPVYARLSYWAAREEHEKPL